MAYTITQPEAKRPNKIILVNAYPRSGATWLVHQLCWLFNAEQGGVDIASNIKWTKSPTKDFEIHKGHYRADEVPDYIDYVVLSIRNPLDIIVSKWYYNGGANDIQSSIDYVVSRWGDWYQTWLDCFEGPIKPMTITYFEGLKLHQRAHLNNIYEDVTGILPTYDKVSEAMNETTLQRLQDKTGDCQLFRRGIIGEHKQLLTASQIGQVKSKLGGVMCQFGYEV